MRRKQKPAGYVPTAQFALLNREVAFITGVKRPAAFQGVTDARDRKEIIRRMIKRRGLADKSLDGKSCLVHFEQMYGEEL